MRTVGNTILITGGATGIGYALAEAFLKEGNEVIICGRRRDKLHYAKSGLPKVHIKACDVTKNGDRKRLLAWIQTKFPRLNVLVNNAGVQKQVNFAEGAIDLTRGENEISVNLEAPIHLSALFIPHLMRQEDAAIINVSSGLAFVPMAACPVYCATKAALHSFTLSLRHQLAAATIKVFEVIPPRVDTDLGMETRGPIRESNRGIAPDEVARAALEGIARDEFEIAVGMAQGLKMGLRTDPEGAFRRLNP